MFDELRDELRREAQVVVVAGVEYPAMTMTEAMQLARALRDGSFWRSRRWRLIDLEIALASFDQQ